MLSPDSLAQDGDSPQSQAEAGPVAQAAKPRAFDAPINWTVGQRLGVGTQTPAAAIDVRTDANLKSLVQLFNTDTSSAAQASFYANAGPSVGLGMQVFGTGFNGATWDGVPLATWSRIRSDTGSAGLILTTGGLRPLRFGTNDNTRMTIISNGNIGVGTANPQQLLHLVQAGDYQMRLENTAIGGGHWNIGQSDSSWNIGGGKLAFVPNSGNPSQASVVFTTNGRVGIGTEEPATRLDVAGIARADILQIDAGGDLAEPFDINGAEEIEPGMVVAIDPDHPGQLRIANRAYDRTVAGVVSGAGGIQPGIVLQQEGSVVAGDHPVALTGRVYVLADAAQGPIAPGDLLTTSETAGHAMKVTDYAQAQGAILGKAMSALDEGTGLVLVLVSLQ